MSKITDFFIEGKLEFFPYKIFGIKDKYYILSNVANSIFQIDGAELELLQYNGTACECLLEHFEEEKIKAILENFAESFIIKTPSNINVIQEKTRCNKIGIKAITLLVCQECNLRCKYCYGDGGEYSDRGKMTVGTAKKSVDYLFDKAIKDDISVIFFGGEPLMQYPLIEEVVEYAKIKGENENKTPCFSITTNATLINEKIARYFAENKFSVTISIDGSKGSNDKTRYYIDGKGAHEKILRGVALLESAGVKMSARATVCPDNCSEMFDNLMFLLNEPFESVYFSPAINLMKKEDYKVYISEIKKMADYFINLIYSKQYDKACKIKNINSIVTRIHMGGIRKVHCGAACNMIAADINGQFYPCHRFVTNKECIVGSVEDGINMQTYGSFIDNSLINNSPCRICWAVALCGGGCPYENYQETEYITVPNPLVCSVMKDIYVYIIEQYLLLPEEIIMDYFTSHCRES